MAQLEAPRTIGFIGTGIMGAGMARSLIRRGHRVRLYNRTRHKAEKVAEAGGFVASCPAEAADESDVIITMLADPAAVFETMQGEQGALRSIGPGNVLIDCSTISPPSTMRLHQMVREQGAEMLDAPVFGSKNEAEQGQLGFLVGGEQDVIARVQSVFDCMGRTRHVGTNGMGSSAKLVLNLIMAGTLQVFHEGMVLSAKAGLEPSAMLELILSSRARSGIIEMKAPQVLNRDFSPFFPLELMAKDMRLVQESAAALDLQLPIASALNAIYAECLKAGLAREDFCSAIKVLEQQADVTVQK